MWIVVVGSRERKSPEDRQFVFAVLAKLKRKYRDSLVVLSTSCDAGIGEFVKERCRQNNIDFQFVEITQRIYADLPLSRILPLFKARNSWLSELGDEFHLFIEPAKKSFVDDLRERVQAGERRVFVYLPGEDPDKFVDKV